jgi:gluconate 2-dehydrogenase gamma chain
MRTMRAAKGRKDRLGRRAFLAAGISAAAGTAVSCHSRAAGGTWRYFTSAQAQTVDAICAQLIPADRDPGAKEAGVVNFIDLQLCRAFKKHRGAYEQGLAAIDADSRAKFGHPFVELTSQRQVEILSAAERHSRAFFDLILTHTREGFYGDPRHGGNRNRVSWKMIGLPYPPVRGREHYQG